MKKVKITNINRFVSFIIILTLIIVFLFIIIFVLKNKNISSNTDISKLNSSKYSDKILEEYEKDGKKQEFLSDYSAVQNNVGMYIIDNSTLDDNSFENVTSSVNQIISSDNWETLNIAKPTKWNGDWSVDSKGIVKFKFSKKSSEPTWSKDEDLKDKLLLN